MFKVMLEIQTHNKRFHVQRMADTFIAKAEGRKVKKLPVNWNSLEVFHRSQKRSSTRGAHERGFQQICGSFCCPVIQVAIGNHIYQLAENMANGVKLLACSVSVFGGILTMAIFPYGNFPIHMAVQ